ncbi:hypothetical protein KEM56_002076 [Ascosphaera pollenicola]|nr:hypothetical protein KEM56_002076 [Ascosphaera pollenicola]
MGMSTSEKFRWKVEKEEQKWEKMSMVKKYASPFLPVLYGVVADYLSRYADNNDYKQFKRSVHEASYADREEAPPLPPASTWFDDVNSNQRKTHRADSDDDEIQISREKQSLKCPITLLPFKQPVTSKRCPHSFEKDAIVEEDLADDLVLARKVRREREREERGGSVDVDDDDDDDDEEEEEEEDEDEDGEREVSVVSDTQV